MSDSYFRNPIPFQQLRTQAYLDGVTSLPAEKIGDEECDHILVNIMKHQRSWEIWLSKADHLPRKMKQIACRKLG